MDKEDLRGFFCFFLFFERLKIFEKYKKIISVFYFSEVFGFIYTETLRKMNAMDDKDIILAMRTAPDKGFRQLMAKYKEPVYWHIRRLVVAHDDAQDAVQETFVRVFRSFPRFDGKGSLTAWIYRIATNEALRLLSRHRPETLPLESAGTAVAGLPAAAYVDYSDLEAVMLQRAILSLPEKQQIAFNLRYYDEMDYDEIAAVMESTPSAAKSNYHLAKGRITEYMNNHG